MYNDFRYRILTEKRASKFYERPLAVSAQRRILVKHTHLTVFLKQRTKLQAFTVQYLFSFIFLCALLLQLSLTLMPQHDYSYSNRSKVPHPDLLHPVALRMLHYSQHLLQANC